ncbi:MAG: aerolysin family beta-barrel pore-forming toxin [Oscillatoriales cyanobacterium C42_A2020_001]|nr:aerolysin family beta-barrel pore-forming toxin [Leptolyngbyaceae cyanobacterium C42_A2020_001]
MNSSAPISPTYLTAKNIGEVANQVANNQDVIRQLANFAHALGFAYAGGTSSQYVGDDFEILNTGTSEKPSYTLKFRYNGADPYASGYKADTRLSITLSNFQVSIDPTSFKYSTPRSNSITPERLDTATAINQTSTIGALTHNFSKSIAEALQNSTTYKFTQGIKTTLSLKIPFTVDQKTELSFSAEQGWTDSRTTTKTVTVSRQYNGPVSARTEQKVDMIALQTSSSVDYTATAKVSFDISYSGFLRAGDKSAFLKKS